MLHLSTLYILPILTYFLVLLLMPLTNLFGSLLYNVYILQADLMFSMQSHQLAGNNTFS